MIEAIATESILIDSSGWLEYLTDDSKAELFIPYFVSDQRRILVSPIVIYEVRKVLLLHQAKRVADDFASQVDRYELVVLNGAIALEAASLSIQYKLHLAVALIYATALSAKAQLITSDAHFKDLQGVTIL